MPPEYNPRDDEQPTKEEWEAYQKEEQEREEAFQSMDSKVILSYVKTQLDKGLACPCHWCSDCIEALAPLSDYLEETIARLEEIPS